MNDNPTDVDDIEDDEVELSGAQPDGENIDAPDSDTAPVTIESLQAEVESLQAQLYDAKEQVLRAQADNQNTKRRASQDVEKAHKFALEKFVADMLPVADNLERAAESATSQEGDFKVVAEGVELTLKSLIDALKRHSVEAVYPEGEPFDPQLHQAMTMVEQPEVEPNTVINVFQRGYTLNGRLVRPAMVVVSKSAS